MQTKTRDGVVYDVSLEMRTEFDPESGESDTFLLLVVETPDSTLPATHFPDFDPEELWGALMASVKALPYDEENTEALCVVEDEDTGLEMVIAGDVNFREWTASLTLKELTYRLGILAQWHNPNRPKHSAEEQPPGDPEWFLSSKTEKWKAEFLVASGAEAA